MKLRVLLAFGLLWLVPNVRASNVDEGPTLHLVYVGGTACGMCKTPAVRNAVRSAWQASRQWAEDRGFGFTATGVADDTNVEAGWRFLKEEGSFDQVIIGRGYFNEGILAYIASNRGQPVFRREFPDLAFPQLLLFREHRSYVRDRVIHVDPPVLLKHAVGGIVTIMTREGTLSLLDKAWPREASGSGDP